MEQVYIVHGGDTDGGSSRVIGVFSTKEKALIEYNKAIARDLISNGHVDTGLNINDEDELDCDDEATQARVVELLSLECIPDLEYSEECTTIYCDDGRERDITFFLSLHSIQ